VVTGRLVVMVVIIPQLILDLMCVLIAAMMGKDGVLHSVDPYHRHSFVLVL